MIEKLDSIPVGRAEDLTGQTFGHLTVLYRVANKSNRPTWQCQCDCGNYFTTLARLLKDGRSVSCGCATNEGHIKDHTGERYGKIIVLSPSVDRAPDGTILWHCRCDCGNELDIRAGNLKRTQSCGKCFRGKDISGQRFGCLVAINFDHTSSTKRSIWKCQCDCGGISFVDITDLTSGKTQSCGCIKSRGEEKIAELLAANNVPFEKQKTFPSCTFSETNGKLIFDFWVQDTYVIEYDGIQHFGETSGWNTQEHVITTQKRDIEKNNWCKENQIPIIRIPYTHFNDLNIRDLKLDTSNFIIK